MSDPTSKPTMQKITFTDANANSFSDKVLRWELLETRLAPILDSMPHVKPVHAELVQLIADAKKHVFDLEVTQAAAIQGSSDRKAMIRTGDGIRSRLASALAFEHPQAGGPKEEVPSASHPDPRSAAGEPGRGQGLKSEEVR